MRHERHHNNTQKIAPRGSSDDAASTFGKKVSIYIGFRYVENFEREECYPKNSATSVVR